MSVPVIFSTGSLWPFGLDRVYGWAAEAGYDGVEIMIDDRWDTHQDAYLNRLAEKHGLPILALHPPIKTGTWRLPAGETLVRRGWPAGSAPPSSSPTRRPPGARLGGGAKDP